MFAFQISELALQVAILYYGGHLVVTGQMSGGTLISFVIYELELGECLEVLHPCCFILMFLGLCVHGKSPLLVLQCRTRMMDGDHIIRLFLLMRLIRLTEHCICLHGPHAGGWRC